MLNGEIGDCFRNNQNSTVSSEIAPVPESIHFAKYRNLKIRNPPSSVGLSDDEAGAFQLKFTLFESFASLIHESRMMYFCLIILL